MARTGAPSTTRRTLHYFWLVTRKHIGLFAALMTATFLFVALLSYGNPYVMSLVVDRVSAGSVAPDEVFSVFGPYIAALILINVAGQAASKVQDYTMYRLEIAASYDLATMSFDALSNQSMSFHSNRFGGTLVSQTTKFMSAYQLLLETITFPFLPVICSVVFTCAILAPRVPVYVAILMVLLAVYAGVSYYMYKRILHLNEQAASAQNQLSGELSDSVANILAVKTYGREDYERGLFDQANREVVARDSKRMWASLTRGIVTACITIAIMSVVAVFIAGARPSWWRTVCPPWPASTASWCSTAARWPRTARTPSSSSRAASTRTSGAARRGRIWKRSDARRGRGVLAREAVLRAVNPSSMGALRFAPERPIRRRCGLSFSGK